MGEPARWLRYGSLFTGYGGLDLALEVVLRARAAWHCERDPYNAAVLERHWPGVVNLGHVEDVDEHAEATDLICAGWPCQGNSAAGKRLGLADERSGLWHEVARVLRCLRPALVFLENVDGLLAPGRGFDVVLGDLASLGFDAEWSTVRAADVGAPHIRRRVFVLASRRGLPDAERSHLRELGQRYGEQHGVTGPALARWGSEDVADSTVAASDEARSEQQGRAGARRGGVTLADTACDDRYARRGLPAGQSDAKGGDDDRNHEPRYVAHGRHSWPPGPGDTEGWQRHAGARPGVRRDAYGPSRGLDARRRRARIARLGNGCVWQQAAYALSGLVCRAFDGGGSDG